MPRALTVSIPERGGIEGAIRMVTLDRSLRDWHGAGVEVRTVHALHGLARRQRLIIHSA